MSNCLGSVDRPLRAPRASFGRDLNGPQVVHEGVDLLTGRALGFEPEEPAGCSVEEGDRAFGVEDEDALLQRFEDVLEKAPLALGMSKVIMNTCQDIDSTSGRILERAGQSVLIQSEDHKEGLRAFREKRKPVYRGR